MDRAYGEEEPRRKPRSGFSSCAEPALQKVDRPRYRRSQTALKQTERALNEAHVSICNHSALRRAESLLLQIGPSTIVFASGSISDPCGH